MTQRPSSVIIARISVRPTIRASRQPVTTPESCMAIWHSSVQAATREAERRVRLWLVDLDINGLPKIGRSLSHDVAVMMSSDFRQGTVKSERLPGSLRFTHHVLYGF